MREGEIARNIQICSKAGGRDRPGDSNSLEFESLWWFEFARLREGEITRNRFEFALKREWEIAREMRIARIWELVIVRNNLNLIECRRERSYGDLHSIESRTLWSPVSIRIPSNAGGRDRAEYLNSLDCRREIFKFARLKENKYCTGDLNSLECGRERSSDDSNSIKCVTERSRRMCEGEIAQGIRIHSHGRDWSHGRFELARMQELLIAINKSNPPECANERSHGRFELARIREGDP